MSDLSTDNPLIAFSNAMADAVEKAGAATVMVNARRRIPATGFLYTSELILTADHVVEVDDDITVGLPDGEEVSASLAGRDPGSDLALLRFGESNTSVASPAREDPRVGQIALAIGRPSHSGIQASLGIVSAIGSAVRVVRKHGSPKPGHRGFFMRQGRTSQVAEQFIRTDAIPYPGFSGGPLINASGQVIGINTSGLVRGMSLAIPIGRAWDIAEALDKHGSVKRGYLGIRSQPVPLPYEQQRALGREQTTGLLLVWIEDGSAASIGGLLVGDILVGLAGEPVSDPEELQIQLSGDVVGEPTPVEILRGGKPETVAVTIGERK